MVVVQEINAATPPEQTMRHSVITAVFALLLISSASSLPRAAAWPGSPHGGRHGDRRAGQAPEVHNSALVAIRGGRAPTVLLSSSFFLTFCWRLEPPESQ